MGKLFTGIPGLFEVHGSCREGEDVFIIIVRNGSGSIFMLETMSNENAYELVYF